jgi:hypothetical protein
MAFVRRDQAQRAGAETGQVHGLRDAPMCSIRHIGGEALAAGRDPLATRADAERGCARDQQADEVGHRRSGDEKTARGLGKAEQLAHPVHDLPLDLDRRVIAAAEIGIETSGEHLRQHAGHVAAAVHPSHETGMAVPRGIGKNAAHELVMHGREIGRPGRHAGAKIRPDVVRDRLPDRPRADVLDIIENVVEHPVPLGPDLLPVLRIEAGRTRLKAPFHRIQRFSLFH